MMAGIALGFQAPTSAMPMLCVSAALAGLLLLGRRRTRAAGCLLLTFLLGAALGIRTANPTLPPEGDAQVTGVVAGEVDFRAEKGQVRYPAGRDAERRAHCIRRVLDVLP